MSMNPIYPDKDIEQLTLSDADYNIMINHGTKEAWLHRRYDLPPIEHRLKYASNHEMLEEAEAIYILIYSK